MAHRLAVLGGVGCVLKRRASFGSTEQSTRSDFAVDLFYYHPRKMAACGSEVRGERVRGKMGSEV